MGGILSSDASSAAVLTETDPHTEGTVLAVDDTPDRLQLLEVLLRQSGYRVLTAAEGREGLKIALDECPDLIISDVSMPVMDGIELCRRVRADARLSAVPFLLVSAMRKDSESVVEGLRAGADDYLEAPYDPMRLIALSARLVERGRYEKTIHESEERFRAFVDHFSEGIWHVEVDPPCSVRLPADEQVEHCLRHGRVADCNEADARGSDGSHSRREAG